MTAPAYRSRTSQYVYNPAGTITLNKPSGVVEGDYMIAALLNNDGSRTIGTVPSGWTLLESQTVPAGDNRIGLWVYGKLAGSSEPSTYTWQVTSASTSFNGSCSIAAYSGSSGVDADGSTLSAALTTEPYDIDAPSVTTLGADRLLVYIGAAKWTATDATGATFTPPSGYTSRFTHMQSGEYRTVEFADKVQAVAGASGAISGDVSADGTTGGNAYTVGVHIALAPSSTSYVARPDSDVSAGAWTASSGSDLYAMLDEESADDDDYIQSTTGSTCEVALATVSAPPSGWVTVVRYRIQGDCTVSLRQGSTQIASWSHSPGPGSPTTYTQTLSGGEQSSISDWSDLRLRFVKP